MAVCVCANIHTRYPVSVKLARGFFILPQGDKTMAAQKTVLIVDDEKDARLLLQEMIETMGHVGIVAENGREALQILIQTPVDLIITDFRMPHMNGGQLLKAVKTKNPQLPVILITGSPDWQLGPLLQIADGFLKKPFNLNEIEKLISQLPNFQDRSDNL